MSLITGSETMDSHYADIQLTLSWSEARRLRTTLPWLLRALADRPDVSPRLRERRRKAYSALDSLLNSVSSQLQQVETDRGSECVRKSTDGAC